MNADGVVRLTDFGISRQLADSLAAQTYIGSFRYMSPERVTHSPYDCSSDIWSLGVVRARRSHTTHR